MEEITSKYGIAKTAENSWELISPIISHPFNFYLTRMPPKGDFPFVELCTEEIITILESSIDDFGKKKQK
jgi:hypothetical protein